jgi:hypothetical protein
MADMPTQTTIDPLSALQPESASSDQFGTNVGETILQQTRLLGEADEPAPSQSRCNLGRTEQKIRLASGTALLAAAVFAPVSRGWRIGFAVAGVSQLVTGAMSYCPLWQALGIDTRRLEER